MPLASSDFPLGSRVKLHPATSAWMQGDRYGIVVKIGRKFIHVEMDSGRVLRFSLPNLDLLEII